MPSATDIGVAIRRARQRKRLTQRQLAEAVGVHVVSVRNWERGTHFPVRYRAVVEDVLDIEIQARTGTDDAAAKQPGEAAPARGQRGRGFLSRRAARRNEGDAA